VVRCEKHRGEFYRLVAIVLQRKGVSAVKAGRLTQTLTPSNLANMLARTSMRGNGHLGLLFRDLYLSSREPRYAGNHRGRWRPSIVRLPGQSQMDHFGNAFVYSTPES